MSGPQADDGVPVDELRRRLYRDGATDEDLRRYRQASAALADEPAPATDVRAHAPRRGWAFGVAAVALVAVAGAGIALTSPRPAPAPTASAPARGAVTVQDVGDGQTITGAAAVSASTPVAMSVDGTAAVGQRFHGTGPAVVSLAAPDPAAFRGGRAAVELTSSDGSPVGWRVLRFDLRRDWTPAARVLARGTAPSRVGAASTVFDWADAPPSTVVVECAKGASWSLRVALAGAPSGRLD